MAALHTPVPLCLPSNFTWDPRTGKVTVDKRRPRDAVSLCKEGRALLEGVKDDFVVVICITGPARTGKSYFLSQIQESVVFELGHTTTSTTTGIWIAVAPTPVTVGGIEARLVLLDAEGLGSTSTIDEDGSSEMWDRKLFTLCALFSSYLIYNSKGVPNRDDLDKLSFIAQFRASLYGHSPTPASATEGGSTEDVVDVAPYFMWLIRDALLQPEVGGVSCTWKAFIEAEILSVDEGAAPKNRRNAIKKAIRTSFRSFNAFGLPPPSADPEVVQNLSKPQNREKINKNFISKLQEVKDSVLSCSHVKVIKSHQITGQQLAMYVSSCVNAVNDECDKFPIQNAWDSLLESKWNEILTKTMDRYDNQANQITFPVSTEDIEKFHDAQCVEVRKYFAQFLASNFDETSAVSYTTKLDSALEGKLDSLKDKNNRERRSHCENVAMELENEHFDTVILNLENHSYVSLVKAKETVIAQYKQKCERGSVSNEVRQELEERMETKISSLQPVLIQASLDRIWDIYEKEIRDQIKDRLPFETNELDTEQQRIRTLCVEQFKTTCRGCDAYQTLSLKVEKDLRRRLTSLEETNLSRSLDACEEVMRSSKLTHFDPIWNLVRKMSISEVNAAKETVLEEYEKNARGPAKDKVKKKHSEEMEGKLCQAQSLISDHAVNDAVTEYKRQLDELLKDGPLESDEAIQNSKSAWEDVQKRFRARCDGLESSLGRICNETLKRKEIDIVNDFKRRNGQLSTEFCEQLMTSLIREILKPSIDNIEIFVSYEEKKELILEQYGKNARGPSSGQVREAFVLKIDSDIKRAEQQRILRGIDISLDVASMAGVGLASVGGKAAKAGAAIAATAKVAKQFVKNSQNK